MARLEWEEVYNNTRYFFESGGRLIQLKHGENTVNYIYDKNGKLLYKEEDKFKIKFKYDDFNKITSWVNPSNEGFSYKYDAEGRLTEEADLKTGKIYFKYSYDSEGRIIKSEEIKRERNYIKEYRYKQKGPVLIVQSYYRNHNNELIKSNTGFYNSRGKELFSIVNSTTYYDTYYNIKDSTYSRNMNTYVYNDAEAVPFKTYNDICINGNCWDGFGKMIVTEGLYTGFFNDGKPNAAGSLLSKKGDLYRGLWINNQFTGPGEVVRSTGVYEMGYYINGKLDGFGYKEYPETLEIGKWSEDRLVQEFDYSFHENVTGCTEGNCENGFGKYILDDGTEIWAFFQNNQPGLGTIHLADKIYTGIIEIDDRGINIPYGTVLYPGGEWYLGELNAFRPEGKGMMYFPKESNYSGGILKDNKWEKNLAEWNAYY